jgi:hypothetical protein
LATLATFNKRGFSRTILQLCFRVPNTPRRAADIPWAFGMGDASTCQRRTHYLVPTECREAGLGNASKLRKSLRVIAIDNDCDLLEVACHRLIESGVIP